MSAAADIALQLTRHGHSLVASDDGEALARSAAAWVADQLAVALVARGGATLVVSGGSTPAAMFEQLANAKLDWGRITIFLADDRWLPHSHADSNARLVREKLLQGPARSAHFVCFAAGGESADKDAAKSAANLARFERPFDVVMLGMGDDGHTASLFPCSQQIDAGLDLQSRHMVLAVEPTTAPYQRLSMSLPRLLNARHIGLLIKGDGKLQVLSQALASGAAREMPIRAFLQQTPANHGQPAGYGQVPLTVFWSP